MALDISLTMFLGMLKSPIMWGLIIFGMCLMGVGGLWLRKQRKLEYKCLIISPAGNSKTSIVLTKAGWFKPKMLLKLWDYGGEEVIKVADGRKIFGIERSNMHFFKGNRCILCWEKGDDKKSLMPIDSLTLNDDSYSLLAKIAPVEIRDVAGSLIRDTNEELKSSLDKYVQWILLGGIIVFALVSIILITQMVNNGQREAGDLILEAGRIVSGSASTAGVSP